MTVTLFVPVKSYVESSWPNDLLEPPSLDVLDEVWIEPIDIVQDPVFTIRTALLFQTELSVGIPGLDSVKLVFAPSGSFTAFKLEFVFEPTPTFRIVDIPIALRLASSLMRPARRILSSEPGKPDTFELDSLKEFLDITLGTVTLSIDLDGNIGFDGIASINLPPSFIGETGVVIEAPQIDIFLDQNNPPAGKPTGWRGIFIHQASLYLPGELAGSVGTLELFNAYIGNGGFSGTVSDTWTPPLSAQFFGMEFSLENVGLTFVQNSLTESEIKGTILLPFFDEPVDVEIGINLDGSVAVNLARDDGLYTLTKDDLLQLDLDSLAFEIDDGVFTTKLSGQVTPLFGGLDWPSFEVKELAIDSEGNVHLDGGWLNLREQYSLDLHGFQMEITKLGFGKTEDGGKWIGFSGGLKLVDGLSAGASVEGLRITWYDDGRGTKITFNGIGVEFDVPDVLYFKGSVAYDEANNKFSGAIKLDLKSLDFTVDGVFVVGSENGQTYMAIYLAMELPSGIPLFSTGLALYGMAGLFALRMEPNKFPDEEWYESGSGKGWYKRPEIGVTDLINKWSPRQGSLAFGAGVTIGTLPDNGYKFSGKVLLAIVFPGPILLLEGKANLLKDRSKLHGEEEPNFRALAVLDNRAGSFLFGLDAQYKRDDTGKLIDIRGSAEAFFDFHDLSAWHLYLGEREPREKRIRAEIFKLFEVDGYFMLDAHQLAMGSWVGYDKEWDFGPLHVDVEAWIENNVMVSWKPTHFHGDLWLHGKAELSVWSFGTSLTVDAQIRGDVFEPFHLVGELTVGIGLPWPLPDFEEDISLEWGPDPIRPPLPLPLKEIAIEHFKVTTSWPLPRGTLLLPNYDRGDGFLVDEGDQPVFDEHGEPPVEVPVVPLDCRPHITFGRAVNDDALIGGNPQPLNPEWERIGDPATDEGPIRVRYGLKELVLEKRFDSNWVPVARKGPVLDPDPNPDLRELFGSWAPIPAEAGTDGASVTQTKLWIWSKNPFDYTRHAGRAWDEWFTDRFTDFPCIPFPPDREICCDFEKIDQSEEITSPWLCPHYPKLKLSWIAPDVQTITVLDEPVDDLAQALCFPRIVPGLHKVNEIIIELSEPAKAVKMTLTDKAGARATGFDSLGNIYGPFSGGQPNDPHIEITGENLTRVVVDGKSETCLLEICVVVGLSSDEVTQREEMEKHLQEEMARWAQEDDVLEPHTTYRLKVVTTVQAEGEEELADFSENFEQTEFSFFRTEGPPGLANLSKPLGSPDTAEFESGLENLARYVEQTVPPTVPDVGEKPVLPRPVYRAYDIGVEFNENYVDLMYRMDRRDLGLYLFDNNNQPVRDVRGRLIVLSNHWGVTESLTLTESEERWISEVNTSTCATIDTSTIPHNKTITSAAEDQVLDPDTFYEARLLPLLFHEDFSEDLAEWEIVDEGENQSPSKWEVRGHKTFEGKEATANGVVVSLDGSPDLPDFSVLDPDFDVIVLHNDTARPSRRYRIVSVDNTAKTVAVDGDPSLGNDPSAWEIPVLGAVVQTSNIWGGKVEGTDPEKPGTMLLRGDSVWTDYRLSVLLSSRDDDAIGVVVRYLDENSYYRFSMDRQRKYRRLVKVAFGVPAKLAEDDFIYRQNQDYLITVEAIGSSLRIYQDGVLIFDVTDDSMDHGRIGLYCWGNTGALFSDVRVDDFRPEAPVAYRFQFTTSDFANFFHHLHSFQDETWRVELPNNADVADDIALAVAPSITPSENEARVYESLATQVLGPEAQQNPSDVQVTRVEQSGEALAFLVRGPEPIDWKRTDLEFLHAERMDSRSERPGTIKLTDVTFGTNQPNEESVTLLLREAMNLTRHRIEVRRLPGPVAKPSGDPVLFVDAFDSGDNGLLYHEEFGPDALDHYTILDEGTNDSPSSWFISDGHIGQTSNIFGGSIEGIALPKPGTMALTGSPSWTHVRIKTTFQSEQGAIGFVFRYQDADNYYRFSMGREPTYRRLTKNVDGVFSVLWEDDLAYIGAQSYHLVIEAYGNGLVGYLDDALLFNVQDPEIGAGRVGLYCWANPGAKFEKLSVENLEMSPILWRPTFADLDEIEIVDGPGVIEGPSDWAAEDGVLSQSSNIHGETDTPHSGTFALGGSEPLKDIEISARLRSDSDGAIGVMFRVTPQIVAEEDEDEETQDYNYYRFSMNRQVGFRRLIKKVGDAVTVLWQDTVENTIGQTYNLTIRAVGSELRGFLDGVLLFAAFDNDLKRGRIGLYCSANTGAHFESVLVADRTRQIEHWRIHDEGTVDSPSVWRLADGALVQTSNIHGGSPSGSDPIKPGTYAVAGEPSWTDYRLIVRLRSDDNDAVGIMFRCVDEDNYYRFSLDAQRSYQRLIKKENGVVTPLWETAGAYPVGEPFTLVMDVIGSRLSGFMNDTQLFHLTDSAHSSGRVGLYSWENTGAQFEEVEVRHPPLEVQTLFKDRFANNDITEWTLIDATSGDGVQMGPSSWILEEGRFHQRSNIFTGPNDRETLSKKGTHAVAGDLSWSDVVVSVKVQSLDNDAIGLLFRYTDENNYYRFSMDSERGYRRLVKNVNGSFAPLPLWEDTFAYEVARSYEITVVVSGDTLRGYLDGVPMFEVVDDDLATGRIGLYTWGNDDANFSQVQVHSIEKVFNNWLLDEPFDFLIPNRWTFVDEGDQEGPSRWEVIDGELKQTSNIFGGSTDGSVPDKPGTYALAGDVTWDDYRVSVRLNSDDKDAIGVMFRYTDENNYHRFSMDRERSYRRLIKKVAGDVTVLWQDEAQYILEREYILTLDCVGDRLTGYLDGAQLFALEDSDLDAGRVGLYCWGNTGASFAEVRVAAPIWTSYYTFGREEKMSAGTRVKVNGGNKKNSLAEEPSVLQRFLATQDEEGCLRFPSDSVDVRIIEIGSKVGHMRRFLSEKEYSSVNARVLRKADGTGFFKIVPDASFMGSKLIAGQYRLKLTYHRNNQAADPDSQVFSQAGNFDPENVIIDIPWQAQ